MIDMKLLFLLLLMTLLKKKRNLLDHLYCHFIFSSEDKLNFNQDMKRSKEGGKKKANKLVPSLRHVRWFIQDVLVL